MEAKTLQITEASVRIADGRQRRTLLDAVSLSLDAGEIALVRGPSGSGKTTLLGLAALMLAPSSGEVWLHGAPTSRYRDAAKAKARRESIGLVFQEFELLPGLTALENVLLPAAPLGPTPAHQARALSLLEQFGIAALARNKTQSLSGGERQRLALARALLMSPTLLLLDEPTAHLDAARVSILTAQLRELASTGIAILACTHDARLAEGVGAATLYELAEGKLSQ
jgi:putative ABC transport system ATP-binding protein